MNLRSLLLIIFKLSLIFASPQRFNTDIRGTFDVIVEPEPEVVVPTAQPQYLENNGQSCKCVPYYLCNNNRMSTDSRIYGAIDVRYNSADCQDVLDVCCPSANELPANTLTQTPPPIVNPSDQRPRECGVRNAGGIDFTVIGKGNEAGFAEFPWMVALLSASNENICGGSLIHPNIILTGAHCVFNISQHNLIVRAGEWDTQTTKERLPHQERTVSSIIPHAEFNPKTLANDIALVFLSSPFTLDQHINTICLPEQDYFTNSQNCYATGWGKDLFGKDGKYSVILKNVPLPMVPPNQCENALRTTRLGRRFVLDKSFVCAGGEENIDTCQGDGGSPLVCPFKSSGDSRYVQVGAVAWGIGCHQAIPAVYTNVAYFRNWIDSYVQSYGYDFSSYSY